VHTDYSTETQQAERDMKTVRVVNNLDEIALFKAAFDLICDPDDWKEPIDCIVPISSAGFFASAIKSMTATEVFVKEDKSVPEGMIHLTSIGYRAGSTGP
jgi:hypothetical protein